VAGQTVGLAKLYEAIGPVLEQAIDCLQQAAHSPMSIWEFREARRTLEKQGAKVINEGLIFRSYEQMRAIEEHARTETKHIRRKNQQATAQPKDLPAEGGEKALSETERSDSDYAFPIVRPFDELEELSL
jgi:putative transposase